MTEHPPQQLVDIGTDGLQAQINLHGAQLWRLVDHDGTDLLWSGDPHVWSGRAPILFPIIGSVTGDVYRYKQEHYTLHRHGFARTSHFTVIEQTADSVLLRLSATEETRKVYPFAFDLDLRFTCKTEALDVAVSVHNGGPMAMPFSFGFHPALRWPLEPSLTRADHAIVFAEPEPLPIRRLDKAGLILPEPQPSPVAGRTLALHDDLFVDDALIFDQLASRSVDYGAQHAAGRHIRVEFENLPWLGVWTKPGAGYICIEPWQGMADPEGFTGDIFAKPGIIALAPGETWQARMVLSVVTQADGVRT